MMIQKKGFLGYLLMAGFAVLAGCRGGHEEKKAVPGLPVAQVGVQKVEEASVGSRMEVAGTVQAVQRAAIAARLSGQIVELPVVLGSQVQKGDLLVKISVAEISARVLQAQTQMEQARRNLAREERLQKQDASTPEMVRSLRDQVRIAEAAHQEAKTMLEYAAITAPFAGTVTRKIASVGDLASPGVVLLEIENDKALQVVVQVPEELILKVRKGDVLPVFIPVAGLKLSGEVAEVGPAADPVSHTAPVKINIAAGADIRAGQFARVALPGARANSLMISDNGVLPLGQMDRVFVVEGAGGAEGGSIARLRLVRIGTRHDGQVEILSGLAAGDLVVVSGAEKLQDGQPVAVQTQGMDNERRQERP